MSPLYRDAAKALARNPAILLSYVIGSMLLAAPLHFIDHALGLNPVKDTLPSWYGMYATSVDMYNVFGSALLQTLCFTALGKEMDKPLWRCYSLREALSRFFMLWLLINLAVVLLTHLELWAARLDQPDFWAFMEFLMLLATLILPIVGACAMHHGRPIWQSPGDSLAPVIQLPMLTVQVMAIYFTAYVIRFVIIYAMAQGGEPWPPLLLTALVGPFALLDILGFAAMWRVCMHYRDHGHNLDNDPYDF